MTPITEQRVGFGLTRVSDYDPIDNSLALGIHGALAGAPDMFAVMRMLHNVEAGASGDELAVLPRRLVELATIGGARTAGLSDRIGSIERGKAADLILVNTDAVNMGPMNDDPSALLVYSASPGNVEAVMVGGRWRKRADALTELDPHRLADAAAASLNAVTGRAQQSRQRPQQ
ncbi:amidohydrolase family protein [Palleronia sp.]|uniref:amidohydrolase family protein n=1 Tax=Palleronia sp. TaxID=1940284 RepID=UPI0035C82877